MSNIKDRLAKVEKKRHGNVTLADDGAPVIFVEEMGYQYNGLFHERLRDLDRGVYQVWAGPAVDFSLTWDHAVPWLAAIEIMVKERGAVYVPLEK